jgi:hypothetical protein
MFLLLWLALAYEPWFRPKEYVDMQKKRRARLKGKWPFLPQSITFSLFQQYPKLDLWSARLLSLLGVLICITILLSSLF